MNKIKIFLIITLLTLVGCSGPQKNTNPDENLINDVQYSQQKVKESTEKINDATNSIEEKSDNIINKSQKLYAEKPSKDLETIGIDAKIIKEKNQEIKKAKEGLVEANVKLETVQRTAQNKEKQIKNLNKELSEVKEERDKLKEDVKTGINKMLKWIIGGCIVAAGIFIALAAFGGNVKGSIIGGVACLAIMVIAITVSQYLVYIAILGLIILVGSIGIVGYQIFVQKKAIKENIYTQELSKKMMPKEIREKIYGRDGETGEAGNIQSKSTQKLVKKNKQKIPNFWERLKRQEN